jgi:hypothetical protein
MPTPAFSAVRTGITKKIGYLVLYLVILNIIIIMASVALHELGHLSVGLFIGCQGEGVTVNNLLNPNIPGIYTALSCPSSVEHHLAFFLGISGFVFLIPFGLAFLIIRNKPERNLALVIIGFSLILAGLDLLLVMPQNIVVYIALAISIALMCTGEIFLVTDYLDYHRHRDRARNAAKRMSKR